MKKIISFFVLFLFFGTLTAQNVPSDTEQKECSCNCPVCPEVPAEKTVEETKQHTETKENEAESASKDDKHPVMFYQPSAGLGIGGSIFSLRVNNDIDFFLKRMSDGTDIYMGLEVDFRYSYLENHSIYEVPFQLNFLFDFPVKHRTIKRIGLWFSGGIDLAVGYLFYYNYGLDFYNKHDNKERDSIFRIRAAWGLGANMLLHKDLTLKLGFDSFYGIYPDLIFAVGYRF